MHDLGFVSAILAEKSFEEVIDFAAMHGFRCVELMCWPKGKAERRYAGITHIDVDNMTEDAVSHIRNYLQQKNIYISGLGYYPNPLDADEEKRKFYQAHIKKVITAASSLNVPVVNTFIGRDQFKSVKENMELFKTYWPAIVQHAANHHVRIGIENCPMLFTGDEWPGGKNLAISPAIWKEMFSIIPGNTLGLNYDPSHMIWQQMNYLQPLLDFSDRLFHIHLKDAKVYKEKLDKVGVLATPLEYHSPRLPGRGDINWKEFFVALRSAKYKGPVVIEFEDKDYEGSEEAIIKGLLETKQFISQYINENVPAN